MRTNIDDRRVILVIQACCILHNLCISTWRDHLSDLDLQRLAGEDYAHQRRQTEARGLLIYKENERRRERLVDEMAELDPEGVDMQGYM